MAHLTVLILTHNEEIHIARAIASVREVATRVLVVDSGSSDATTAIATQAGAEILTHPFLNHADQVNWALDQMPATTEWVLRLDADEILTKPARAELREQLAGLGPDIAAVILPRRMAFLGRVIRWGGLFPVPVVRLFRHGHARAEARWMDEHMIADGKVVAFKGEILDDNLQPLGWWITKHNGYAAREALEMFDKETGVLGRSGTSKPSGGAGRRRWIKDNVYARLPGGLRAAAYFFYRFVLRLGFLDGPEGRKFHFLQGFWYRYLVDAKLAEVRSAVAKGASPRDAVRDRLGIDLDKIEAEARDAA